MNKAENPTATMPEMASIRVLIFIALITPMATLPIILLKVTAKKQRVRSFGIEAYALSTRISLTLPHILIQDKYDGSKNTCVGVGRRD